MVNSDKMSSNDLLRNLYYVSFISTVKYNMHVGLYVGGRTLHGTTVWFMCGDNIINRTAFTSQEVRNPSHSPSIGVIVMATPTKVWSAN